MAVNKIALQRVNQHMHFELTSNGAPSVYTDNPAPGEERKGASPLNLLLMGIAGCSGIDMVNILGKMKQPLVDIKATVEGERDTTKTPAPFTKIKVHFQLYGDLSPTKVEKALKLTFEKYCSVSIMLEKSAEIEYDYEILE